MPDAVRAGEAIPFETFGSGRPVVLVMGAGQSGRAWRLHQVPALVEAGYAVTIFDNRGSGTRADVGPVSMPELVADTAAVIEACGAGGPVLLVGTSLGARVVAETALLHPEMVQAAVLLAAHARLDAVQVMLAAGEIELAEAGGALPARLEAAHAALHNLSPRTLTDPRATQDWLELFELYPPDRGPGALAQQRLAEFDDRSAAYADIAIPILALAFADDRMIPPFLAREVADAVPKARYLEIQDCGHFGYLERPGAVNRAVLDFFAEH